MDDSVSKKTDISGEVNQEQRKLLLLNAESIPQVLLVKAKNRNNLKSTTGHSVNDEAKLSCLECIQIQFSS